MTNQHAATHPGATRHPFGGPRVRSAASRRSRAGFTIIELLVVVTVLLILVGLVTGVGIRVFRNQEAQVTRGVLQTLDRALDEYQATKNAAPDYRLEDYERVPGDPVGESTSGGEYFSRYLGDYFPRRPDTSVFLKEALGVGQVKDIVGGVGERFLVVTVSPGSRNAADSDVTPSVVDAWATDSWANPWDPVGQQLIYYVHPRNKLAQELYGRCINGRAYFMSAGPDLKYGLKSEAGASPDKATVEGFLNDNIYSYTVGPVNKTQAFYDQLR